jgi:signal transduction histidine kinase
VTISFQRFFLSLVFLTLLSLYAHKNWLTRSVFLDAYSQFTASASDDRSEGGKSIAHLEQINKIYVMRCDIQLGYQWPFCELNIRLSEDNIGIDFTQFETLRLITHIKGPEAKQSIRVFIRNFDPAYSQPGNYTSLKPHEIVFDPTSQNGAVEFKLSQFMVASWWVQEHPTDVQYLGPQLNHITTIGFATSGNVTPGLHEIVVESIELRGLWVSTENFRLVIIFVWLFSILSYLFYQWKKTRQDLSQSDQQRQQLHLSNEQLEQVVSERTSALAMSNNILIESLQNLDITRKELVHSEKNAALGSLVSGISHELNTPIGNAVLISSTIIDTSKQFNEELKAGISKKKLVTFLADISRGAEILLINLEKAATLIKSFKQLSADQSSEQRRHFTLDQVMKETQLVMEPSIQKTTHQLQIVIDPNIIMDSYPGPLSQVIMNLINNALLHAFDGMTDGQMFLKARLLENAQLEICFTDNGVGIPAQVLEHVFEPFFTTKLGKGGSGLGMNLAYNIVTKMLGGKIDIFSVFGQGSTIRMLLPLSAPLVAEKLAKIGIPTDVIADYHQFLSHRKLHEIEDFSGAHCRRDVVELALFLREMQTHLPELPIDLVPIDSYANGIAQVRAGKISALATSCWYADLQLYLDEIIISNAVVQEGQSRVGLYCLATNKTALAIQSIDDLRALKIVSNSDWSADWETLNNLKIEKCIDVKTWRQMVYMVSCGEADILLAPFPSRHQLKIELDDCTLVPIPNHVIALHGSRHFVAACNSVGVEISKTVFPAMQILIENGSISKAFNDCGFFNQATASWKIINEKNIPF